MNQDVDSYAGASTQRNCGVWLWGSACRSATAVQALVEGGGIDPSVLPAIAAASWVGACYTLHFQCLAGAAACTAPVNM